MIIHTIKKRDDNFKYVLGLDLDGCVADFYGFMRNLMVDWHGKPIDNFPEKVSYGLPEWGLRPEEYDDLHRYAVVQREMFREILPIPGAAQVLRDLSNEGVEIRIITHRLFLNYFHKQAASQTIDWLEIHGIPYRELCFVKNKSHVQADIYIEDTVSNLDTLKKEGKKFVCFTNSTNVHRNYELRADNWDEAGTIIREDYQRWSIKNELPISDQIGVPPVDLRSEKFRTEN